MLTGESVPVAKRVEPVAADAPPAERESMVFAGTGATRGHAAALVTATGASSEVGRLTELMQGIRRLPTPLQLRLGALARTMAVVGGASPSLLGGDSRAQGAAAEEAFLVGVAVAVAAVPEGLAATVTIALALGARDMAARGRDRAEDVCGRNCRAGDGHLRRQDRHADREPASDGSDLSGARLVASVTCSRQPCSHRSGGAAIRSRRRSERRRSQHGLSGRRSEPAVHEIPFDAVRKRMTVVLRRPEGRIAFVKGAPELVLERSLTTRRGHDSRRRRTPGPRRASASSPLQSGNWISDVGLNEDDVERELVLVGLLALHDPLRATAAQAVADARGAGIDLKMLTGDHPVTARAIAASLGLDEGDVFARITPADKLHIVEELQESGEVVAVTGDGVNDAPALRRADVGIAMGRSGSEAAREASDVVLTNDELGTIVAAVREGRRITRTSRSSSRSSCRRTSARWCSSRSRSSPAWERR